VSKISVLRPLRFVKVRRLTQDELKALYYIHDRVSQLLTETLSSEPTSAAFWQVIAVEQTTFGDVLEKYPRDTVWSLLGFGESLVGGVALIIDKESAIALVRQVGTPNAPEPGADITEFELSQIDGKIQQFSEAFSTIWGEYHPLSLQLATFPNTPSIDEFRSLLVGIEKESLVAMVTFRITMVAREVQKVSLIFPQPYLEPLSNILQDLLNNMKSENDFEQVQDRILLVDDIKTSIIAELGSTQMTFSEIQSIEENDFIKLNQRYDEPLIIKIGKNTFIKGRPGTTEDGQYLAIQIVEF
jgi:flagellar motor switch protein FliM